MDAAEYDLLIQKAILGDGAAFESLFALHRGEVLGCITESLGHTAQHAEDVLQETALAALAAVRNYQPRPGTPFLAWLIRIGQNKAVDALRRMNLDRKLGQGAGGSADDSSGGPGVSKIPAPQATPGSAVARREASILLYNAVESLEERSRLAVFLHLVEGFTYVETAEKMSAQLNERLTDGQVKHYVRRGLDRLEELLPPEAAFFTDASEGEP